MQIWRNEICVLKFVASEFVYNIHEKYANSLLQRVFQIGVVPAKFLVNRL